MRPILSLIIVEYFSLEAIDRCFSSFGHLRDVEYEVICVSNSVYRASFREEVRRRWRLAQWIFNSANLGFAHAVNQGIAIAKGKVYFILNPDAELTEGNYVGAVEYLLTCSDVGILGPKVVGFDGILQDSCRQFPSPGHMLSRAIQRVAVSGASILEVPVSDEVVPVDWVSGAAIMIRASLVDLIGPMDSGYFMYVEDMDWCRRVWRAGYKVMYWPAITVKHTGARSSTAAFRERALPSRLTMIHLASYSRYVWKTWLLRPSKVVVRSEGLVRRGGEGEAVL